MTCTRVAGNFVYMYALSHGLILQNSAKLFIDYDSARLPGFGWSDGTGPGAPWKQRNVKLLSRGEITKASRSVSTDNNARCWGVERGTGWVVGAPRAQGRAFLGPNRSLMEQQVSLSFYRCMNTVSTVGNSANPRRYNLRYIRFISRTLVTGFWLVRNTNTKHFHPQHPNLMTFHNEQYRYCISIYRRDKFFPKSIHDLDTALLPHRPWAFSSDCIHLRPGPTFPRIPHGFLTNVHL